MTTEKELDTVEVLKAIQKAKEVKCKLSNSEKKVGLLVGGGRRGCGEGVASWLHHPALLPLAGCACLCSPVRWGRPSDLPRGVAEG